MREANWDENAYETEIWIADSAAGESRQLTNAKKSSLQPAWSPDGRWLGFISDRDGKRQIYRIAVAGGEAEKLTSAEDGVNELRVVAVRRADRVDDDRPRHRRVKDREKRWGDIRIEDQDQRYTHLHLFDVATRTTTGALTTGAVRGRRLRLVARRRAPSPSITASPAIPPTAARPTFRSSTSPPARAR